MIVLVVDDERLIRFGVGELLVELGHEPLEAATGRQALQLLNSKARIQLLLTDFRMPGLSGLDLVAQCREMRPDLKIILMTGYTSINHVFPENCPVRLEKPFNMTDLKVAIERAS